MSDLFMAGRNLAILAMSDLLQAGGDACSIEAKHRPGRSQCDSIARAIKSLRTAPPEVVAGFAAVLTDMLGTGEQPSDPVGYYEGLSPAQCGFEPHLQLVRPRSEQGRRPQGT